MVAEWCQDLSDYSGQRCVQCGELIDPVFLQNRRLQCGNTFGSAQIRHPHHLTPDGKLQYVESHWTVVLRRRFGVCRDIGRTPSSVRCVYYAMLEVFTEITEGYENSLALDLMEYPLRFQTSKVENPC